MSVPQLSETKELALLEHLSEKHGLDTRECPSCSGNGCMKCDGVGVVYCAPNPRCDDPQCWASVRLAAIAAESRS